MRLGRLTGIWTGRGKNLGSWLMGLGSDELEDLGRITFQGSGGGNLLTISGAHQTQGGEGVSREHDDDLDGSDHGLVMTEMGLKRKGESHDDEGVIADMR